MSKYIVYHTGLSIHSSERHHAFSRLKLNV